MQVAGFYLTKYGGKREKELKPDVKINNNVEIVGISKEKVELIKEDNVLKIEFKYTINYEPKYAEVGFEGYLLILAEQDLIKELLKSWKKKKVPDKVRFPLFNLILTRCNIKAFHIEEQLALPPHLPFPRVAPQQDPQDQKSGADYTG